MLRAFKICAMRRAQRENAIRSLVRPSGRANHDRARLPAAVGTCSKLIPQAFTLFRETRTSLARASSRRAASRNRREMVSRLETSLDDVIGRTRLTIFRVATTREICGLWTDRGEGARQSEDRRTFKYMT